MTNRRHSLPVTAPAPRRPTVDAIRTRLGGRGTSGQGVGAVVYATTSRGRLQGVVLFASVDTLDVWVDEGRVQRVPRTAVQPFAHGDGDGGDSPARALGAVADDVRVFAMLREGHRVRYEDGGGSLTCGTLREKCRWGAIVERDDGVLVGVGFRRVWPASTGCG